MNKIKQFSMTNIYSIHEEITIDFTSKNDILSSLILYGKNNSGKTNVLKALNDFSGAIKSNIDFSILNYHQFRFENNDNMILEIVMVDEVTEYRYGISINVVKKFLAEEWFYKRDKSPDKERIGKEVKLFQINREEEDFYFNKNEISLLGKVETFATENNHKTLINYLSNIDNKYASNFLKMISKIEMIDPNSKELSPELLDFLSINDNKEEMSNILRGFDLSISDLEIKKVKAYDKNKIDSLIEKLNSNKKLSETEEIEFKFLLDRGPTVEFKEGQNYLLNVIFSNGKKSQLLSESDGTQKLFILYANILKAINDEKILLIDEIEAMLHPLVIENIMENIFLKDNKSTSLITTHYLDILDLDENHDRFAFLDRNKKTLSTTIEYLSEYILRKGSTVSKKVKLGAVGKGPII